jgi:glycine cleavage system transcriptional repressor
VKQAEVMKKHLVLSVIGPDRPGIVNELSRAILDNQCNIEDSRMTVLGGEFALIVLVSGNWNNVAKLETALPKIEKKLALTVVAKPTEPRVPRANMVPYTVDVVTMDHAGIVRDIANFFSTRQINIEEMNTWTYPAAHTGTPMFSMSMTVSIPADLPIGQLRQDFTGFCDELNIDATLEPTRQ